MANELIHCTDCGAVFKAVPAWLATANVRFTCTSCPKRARMAGARFEPAPEPIITLVRETGPDSDDELDPADIEDLDELDIGEADLDALGEDDKEI